MKQTSDVDFYLCSVTVCTSETGPVSATVFEPTFTAATTKAYNITSICGDQASEKIECS